MGYVLVDGLGKRIVITSACEDITYAQAEAVLYAERLKGDLITPFVVAFPTCIPDLTVSHFLEAYKSAPKDLERIEAIRKKIQSDGFMSMVEREYADDFDSFRKINCDVKIARSLEGIVDQLSMFRTAGNDSGIDEVLEAAQANPLHAGVHMDFQATLSDELWIADAAKALRKATPERWLRRMLCTLRFFFKGVPKTPLPNKNDHCPCDSTRKYGKCCGIGVEVEDPEPCKFGKHRFTVWRLVADKYVRSCEACYRVYEAPWFEKKHQKGTDILIVGCRACPAKPSPGEISEEIAAADRWNSCAVCGKSLGVSFMLLEHQFSDGKHLKKWMATEAINRDEATDLTSHGLGKSTFAHKECFMKALPKWPEVAKPIIPDGKDISMELPASAKDYSA